MLTQVELLTSSHLKKFNIQYTGGLQSPVFNNVSWGVGVAPVHYDEDDTYDNFYSQREEEYRQEYGDDFEDAIDDALEEHQSNRKNKRRQLKNIARGGKVLTIKWLNLQSTKPT